MGSVDLGGIDWMQVAVGGPEVAMLFGVPLDTNGLALCWKRL